MGLGIGALRGLEVDLRSQLSIQVHSGTGRGPEPEEGRPNKEDSILRIATSQVPFFSFPECKLVEFKFLSSNPGYSRLQKSWNMAVE